jgi:hypothetical protein
MATATAAPTINYRNYGPVVPVEHNGSLTKIRTDNDNEFWVRTADLTADKKAEKKAAREREFIPNTTIRRYAPEANTKLAGALTLIEDKVKSIDVRVPHDHIVRFAMNLADANGQALDPTLPTGQSSAYRAVAAISGFCSTRAANSRSHIS